LDCYSQGGDTMTDEETVVLVPKNLAAQFRNPQVAL
jgi:hypothetical protein